VESILTPEELQKIGARAVSNARTPEELALFKRLASEPVPAVLGDAKLPVFNANWLLQQDFAPLKWCIPDFLPQGTFLFAGKPKIGKSWAALSIALAVATGGRAFGKIPVEQGSVLYLGLEDGKRRLKSRTLSLLQDDPDADLSGLDMLDAVPRGREGCLWIGKWLESKPSARLVVVDVLAKLRAPVTAKANVYDSDYEAVGLLKSLSDAFNVTILLVHHTRKAEAEDIFDTVSGSTGLTGAADGTLVLAGDRFSSTAKLALVGRDVERDGEYVLRRDSRPGRFSWLIDDTPGAAVSASLSREDQILFSLVKDASKPLSCPEIVHALEEQKIDLGKSVQAIERQVQRLTEKGVFIREKRGLYTVKV